MMKNPATFFTLLLYIFLATGCISPTMNRHGGESAPPFAPNDFNASDFGIEIEKMLRIIESSETSLKEKAEAHRRLAILYLIPANPNHDQDKALEQLGSFLELAPHRLDKKEASDWVLALDKGSENDCRELKEKHLSLSRQFAQIDTEKKKLAATNFQLVKDKEKLAADNIELKKIIDKIKKLDLSMEQKRKDYLR